MTTSVKLFIAATLVSVVWLFLSVPSFLSVLAFGRVKESYRRTEGTVTNVRIDKVGNAARAPVFVRLQLRSTSGEDFEATTPNSASLSLIGERVIVYRSKQRNVSINGRSINTLLENEYRQLADSTIFGSLFFILIPIFAMFIPGIVVYVCFEYVRRDKPAWNRG